jgi:hypothetical protein
VITIGSKARHGVWRVWVALGLLLALAAASCNKEDHDHKEVAFDIEAPPEADRPLNQTETDSLRSMKITHRVVRDEYWEKKGGVIANDRVEVWYSNRKIFVLQAMAVLKQMDQVASLIKKTFGQLPSERLVVVCAPNLDTFRSVTGRDWWHYALVKGDTISMQTPMTLFMRGLLMYAARQEYTRWALGQMTNEKAPAWLVWGMAAHFANERDVFRGQRKEYAKVALRMDVEDINKQLTRENDRLEFRRAIYNAYLMVNQLIEKNGMPSVAAFILATGEQPDMNAAAQSAFGKSYDDVLAQALAFEEPPVEAVADSTAPAPAGHNHAGEQ